MVAGWWPCCCGDGGGGPSPPDADGCCKCIQVDISGFVDVNCAYAAYLNGIFRLEYDGPGTAGFNTCGISSGTDICIYSTTFDVRRVEDYAFDDAANCGCTNGETSTPGTYCRTVELKLEHERGGTGPWTYSLEMKVPLRKKNVADPTECEVQTVVWTGSLTEDCSQHPEPDSGPGTSLAYSASCSVDNSTACYSDTVVVDATSSTAELFSPVDCFCNRCSETDQIDWTLTFDGATNDSCTDCADLAGTFVADSMVSNCRWTGKYPEAVTNCNGYTDVLALVDVSATLIQLRLYYGTAADAILEDDWLTGSPAGVPTVAYDYVFTSGSACVSSAAGVTPTLGNMPLAGCSSTAIAGSFDYSSST